ncbi:UDP-N-acetyl-D-mannosaminuronic acid dehydrogenase [Pasteurellaceae bacterium RH1A]|nr:UDP-N-acetyl-D-mannosaminuronic acid dehydrogenase [Pasteurellaceae bacterium RH1A]
MAFEKICILGLGYIGLPTAMAFASQGYQVLGVDTKPQRLAALAQGQLHFVEKALEQAVQKVLKSAKLDLSEQAQPADAFVIAVPTPLTAERQPDLSHIQSAAQMIAPHLAAGNLVVLESTSPVGTTEKLADWLQALRPDLRFPHRHTDPNIHLAYCPERVLPNNVMVELFENDRIIGGLSPACTQQAVALYQIFARGQCLSTQARTAEMCKLAENSFRDVNLAFANELSMLCDKLDVDVWELTALANRHPRVNILQPGAGVGGHCIAVDPWFLAASHPELTPLIRTARQVNDSKPQWVIDKVKAALADCAATQNCRLSDLTLACFGLTFKADIDDLRESPALAIAQRLSHWHPGKTLVVEPHITQLPQGLKAKLSPAEKALKEADVVVLLVEHQAFLGLKPDQQWVVDVKGVWSHLET